MGKRNDAFLLSDGDRLRLSCNTSLVFRAAPQAQTDHFDLVQEHEMQSFRDRYVVTDRLLGAGAFGKVFMAIEQTTRTQLACKIVDLRLIGSRAKAIVPAKRPQTVDRYNLRAELKKVRSWGDQKKREIPLQDKLSIYFREFEILSSISHPNIIALDKVLITNKNLYIFQDLVTAGDLFSYLHSKNHSLMEVEAAVILRQILIAVQFLHERNIAHRDLKPENIMMTGLATGARIVLTDFGSARRILPHQRVTTMAGSEQYGAPEMFNPQSRYFAAKRPGGYTLAADIWSVGVIAALLLLGFLPFDETPGQHNPRLASKGDLSKIESSPRWRNLRERPKSFIRGLLVFDESDRMTAKEALSHAWFSNEVHKTDFENLYRRTIRHWRPRLPNVPYFEFVQGRSSNIRSLECSQKVLWESESQIVDRRRSRDVPVEPPYRPFPRKMHEQGGLWPKRRNIRGMSQEVQEAIETNWSRTMPERRGSSPEGSRGGPPQFKKPLVPTLRRSTGNITSFNTLETNTKLSAKNGLGPPWMKSQKSHQPAAGSADILASSAENWTNTSTTRGRRPDMEDLTSLKTPYRQTLVSEAHTEQRGFPGPSSILTPAVGRFKNVELSKLGKKVAPVPLYVQSRSRLNTGSRSRSRSVTKRIPMTPTKRRKASIFEQESDEDDTTGGEDEKVAGRESMETYHRRSDPGSKEEFSYTWAHSGHLRVTLEDME